MIIIVDSFDCQRFITTKVVEVIRDKENFHRMTNEFQYPSLQLMSSFQ